MNDKAIRAAKLTAAGLLDKARARTAVTRAGGQIAPSKYLPNVPRQVHADGGRIHANKGGKMAFMQGNHPDVPEVLYHGNAAKIVENHQYHGDGKWTSEIDQEATNRNLATQDFSTFKPSRYGNYGPGIYLSDSPKVASDYAQGIRADQTEAKPHGQVMKLHVSMKQPFTEDVLRHPAWIDYIKNVFNKYNLPQNEREQAQAVMKKLDDGTATMRDVFLSDTPHGTMVNQWGHHEIHDTIRNSGFDGIIASRPDGTKEYIAFKPEQVKSATGNQGTFDPTNPDMTKAEGGRIRANKGGKMNEHGMYSKAAQIIRGLSQERGTAEQMIAAAKSRGMKDAELQNFGPLPTGKISREDLARAFEARIPSVRVDQYGENPAYLSRQEQIERKAMRDNPHNIPMMPFEQRRLDELNARHGASAPINVVNTTSEDSDGEEVTEPVDPQYKGYHIKGGTNYRERLLRLNQPDHPAIRLNQMIDYKQNQLKREISAYGEDHPIVQEQQKRLQELIADRDRALQEHGPMRPPRPSYQSSHWPEHSDVLAHIRMQDRMVGNRKMLHVEELQSDWGQSGRDEGFNDNSAKKAYDDHVEDMRSRMKKDLLDQGMPEDVARPLYENAQPWHLANYHGETDKLNELRDAVVDQQGKVPAAPYVTNTQHWTDLALKHVLREAALGGYDGIVFTPGQAQADRYSLDKRVHNLSLKRPADGNSFGRLTAMSHIGTPLFDDEIKDEKHLHSLVGRDVADKLLSSQGVVNHNEQTINHYISGGDLKMGGQGMRTYYDNMVPKSVMRLAQMHDPAAAPGQPVPLKGDNGEEYQGFHLPMTDKMRQGILNEGFPAMKRGGAVGYGDGGPVEPDIQNPMSIFPKPQRMFPEDQRPAGGQYLSMPNKADVTGHKAETATIGVAPGGKPFFRASQNAVDQTGSPGRGSATTKTNLFKQKAGWKWQEAPEWHENTDTIVSVEHRGRHFYALNAHFPKGVDLARYENATSEPRLRPTTQGNVELGPQAGSISVRGKSHPVYHHVIVKADGGAVDAALAATRRFTKDGQHVTMRLKD